MSRKDVHLYMLEKLGGEFTKSRPLHSNDNALAESKNVSVCASIWAASLRIPLPIGGNFKSMNCINRLLSELIARGIPMCVILIEILHIVWFWIFELRINNIDVSWYFEGIYLSVSDACG